MFTNLPLLVLLVVCISGTRACFSNNSQNQTFPHVIEHRRSIRDYTNQYVSEDVLDRILHAGLRAPSSLGEQQIHFTVSRNRRLNKEVSDIVTGNPNLDNIFYNAPIVVYVHSRAVVPGFDDLDGAVAVQNMLLQAKYEGLGSCAIGYLVSNNRHDLIKAKVGIPLNHQLVIGIILGYGKSDGGAAPEIKPGRVRKIPTY
ncbi:hypothetical protein P9112_011443 [Eukaryota sp. TZLM1-RC]